MTDLKYSWSCPGGADQLSCLLQISPRSRDPGLHAGRLLQAHISPGSIWDGQLDEPAPGQDGWQITAHGCGTFGAQFNADHTGHWWGPDGVDSAINAAIQRTPNGLRWVNPGVCPDGVAPEGMWLGQAPDPGSIKIDAMLNLICSRGGLVWQVKTGARGNVLTVGPLPTQVTRVLVATSPVGRTITDLVTVVQLRYCWRADENKTGGQRAAFTSTWTSLPKLTGVYGRTEAYVDLSDAGVMTEAQAKAVGDRLLSRYWQALYAGPFTVAHGQYLTRAGTPVALRVEKAGEVAMVVLADYGGQVPLVPAPVFVVGGYEYDGNSGTAQVTPMGTIHGDWAALVETQTSMHTGPKDPLGIKTGM